MAQHSDPFNERPLRPGKARLRIHGGFLLAFTLALLVASCGSEAPTRGDDRQEEVAQRSVPVPRFDRDSAYHYVAEQLDLGPRVPGSDAHRAAATWLEESLRAFGATVTVQSFEAEAHWGETLTGYNIIGQYNPQARKRVLLAAHWDTRFAADSPLAEGTDDQPVPGADDGASGVGVLLEVARQLQQQPVAIGVDIVFFDLEDQGESGTDNEESWALGAQHWSRNPHKAGYQAEYGILLDMVGARNARFPKEYWSVYFARQLVDKVWTLAQNMGYGNYFVSADGGGVTDDHYFVNTIAGIPMIDIINRPQGSETGFGAHWHTLDDDIDVIDKRTLGAVGQVILAVVYRENNRTF